MNDDESAPLIYARLLDVRLHETLDEPFMMRRARLYGCTLSDPGGPEPARLCFLGEHGDVYALLAGPVGAMAREFDGAALAVTAWGAPLDGPPSEQTRRPSQHPARYRMRVSSAVDDGGIVSSVLRSERQPDTPMEMGAEGIGRLPEAMLAMWRGEEVLFEPRWARRAARRGRHLR